MMIAEFSITGVMFFMQAYYPVAAMLPLLFFTVLFWLYSEQRHFLVARYLPLKDCREIDMERREDDFSFLFGKYKQPAMKAKLAKPINIAEYCSSSGSSTISRSSDKMNDLFS